jgi:hypothetical protein
MSPRYFKETICTPLIAFRRNAVVVKICGFDSSLILAFSGTDGKTLLIKNNVLLV